MESRRLVHEHLKTMFASAKVLQLESRATSTYEYLENQPRSILEDRAEPVGDMPAVSS